MLVPLLGSEKKIQQTKELWNTERNFLRWCTRSCDFCLNSFSSEPPVITVIRCQFNESSPEELQIFKYQLPMWTTTSLKHHRKVCCYWSFFLQAVLLQSYMKQVSCSSGTYMQVFTTSIKTRAGSGKLQPGVHLWHLKLFNLVLRQT